MTEDEYDALNEGRTSITDTCRSATKVVREQVQASEWLRGDTIQARCDRYAMAFGALLAFVAEPDKAELVELVRNATLVVGEPPSATGPGAGWDDSHPASEVPA